MANLRAQSGEVALAWLAPVIAFYLVVLCIWGEIHLATVLESGNTKDFDFHYVVLLLTGGITYVICVLVKLKVLSMSPARAHLAYMVIMMLPTIRLAVARENASFFTLSPVRVMCRMIGGLVLLDCRKAIFWNVVMSVTVIGKYWDNERVFQPGVLVESSGLLWTVQEISVLCFTMCTLYCVERWQFACIRARV